VVVTREAGSGGDHSHDAEHNDASHNLFRRHYPTALGESDERGVSVSP